jgi:hypothetical protein
MTKLLITAEQFKATTSISSATDNELISQKIYYAQISDVTRVLGQSLVDKITTDFANLQGVYKTIYEKYIIDMHVFYTAYYFTLFNEVKQSNVGNTILSVANGQPTQKTYQLAEQYKNLAVTIEDNFRKFMENTNIPEWDYEKKDEETTNFNDFY